MRMHLLFFDAAGSTRNQYLTTSLHSAANTAPSVKPLKDAQIAP